MAGSAPGAAQPGQVHALCRPCTAGRRARHAGGRAARVRSAGRLIGPPVRTLRAIARLLHAVGLALRGWWIIRTRFELLDDAHRAAEVERWAQRMLQVLGIRLVVQGTPPPARQPMLVISNHISWLDILTLHAARHVRFVSKSAVRKWPLIGLMASAAGTLYIERERRRDAMRVVHHMTEALRNG
ncbi:MAG: 1-acyl-sn-glycerol-3-phosphate acyltransferase, partial [Comamonadaceae bacterium]